MYDPKTLQSQIIAIVENQINAKPGTVTPQDRRDVTP